MGTSICKAPQIGLGAAGGERPRTGGKIELIHAGNCGVCGARKTHRGMYRRDVPVARNTVERLLRQRGMRGISRSQGPQVTQPAPELLSVSNEERLHKPVFDNSSDLLVCPEYVARTWAGM